MALWRIKFSLKGRLAYLSHLDLLTLWERALRRGNIAVAYSCGFNPHMLISFGPAHAVGMETEGDYLDIEIKDENMQVQDWLLFNEVLPEGLKVCEARIIEKSAPSLMQCINLAEYKLRISDIDIIKAQKAAEDFFAAEKCIYIRKTPKGEKTLDFRPCVLKIEISGNLILLQIKLTNTGTPKPAEIVQMIAPEARVLNCCRTGLYIQDENGSLLLP